MKYHVGDILFSSLNDKYAFTVVKTKGDRMCIVAAHDRFGEKISKCYEARKNMWRDMSAGHLYLAKSNSAKVV